MCYLLRAYVEALLCRWVLWCVLYFLCIKDLNLSTEINGNNIILMLCRNAVCADLIMKLSLETKAFVGPNIYKLENL